MFLTNNVVVEVGNDFGRGRQFFLGVFFFRFGKLVFNFAGFVVLQHHAASFYTFVADEGVFAFDQIFNVVSDFPQNEQVRFSSDIIISSYGCMEAVL